LGSANTLAERSLDLQCARALIVLKERRGPSVRICSAPKLVELNLSRAE
jgi:hypothetical protein